MRFTLASVNPFLMCVIIFTLVSSCATEKYEEDKSRNLDLKWFSGYQMSDLLLDAFTLNTQDDFSRIMMAPWYAEINVKFSEGESDTVVTNCVNYLDHATNKTRASKENENNALIELAVMCKATQLLVDAENATSTYIENGFFDETMPNKFPSALAFQTSTAEADKNKNDASIRVWSDINKNLKSENNSPEQVRFFDASGEQVIMLIAQGDFNNDGIEDVLISSRDSVTGGSYFNLRLFVLTKLNLNEWTVLSSFLP